MSSNSHLQSRSGILCGNTMGCAAGKARVEVPAAPTDSPQSSKKGRQECGKARPVRRVSWGQSPEGGGGGGEEEEEEEELFPIPEGVSALRTPEYPHAINPCTTSPLYPVTSTMRGFNNTRREGALPPVLSCKGVSELRRKKPSLLSFPGGGYLSWSENHVARRYAPQFIRRR